ncbi:TetR/AcrR family transcriptional regulator [Rubrobacter indicoceani]|uniref:TetR/AcrR family transcriptional regulator n=1 Tax=Rubrobacter indicoceani TaxID=2051957 RepID=UPI0013C40B32|nr:TetR/AcrR family transcriptional regulator [Rubrobacter indicoceani]
MAYKTSERSDAATNRRRILSAARRLFDERGVGVVSMHEVGRSAGVGQGTLYRRFRNKGELCAALLEGRVEEFEGEARGRIEGGEESALELLGWFLERLADFNEENGPLLEAIRDSRVGGREVEMRRNPFYGWLRRTVAGLLRKAEAEGETRRDLDVEVLTDIVLAPLDIDLWIYQREEQGLPPRRIVAAILDLVLKGLKATD